MAVPSFTSQDALPRLAETCRVFVGNLSYSTSWQDLKDHMKQAGRPLKADIAIGSDGRSKGYGLVQYESGVEAATAVCLLHDSELHGRSIICRADRQKHSAGGRRIYVRSLAWDVAWQDLKDHFRQAGDVVHAEIIYDAHTAKSKGCGLVEFSKIEETEVARDRLNNSVLKGRKISIREDREDFTEGGASYGARLYVGNLAWQVAWYDLKDHFTEGGFKVRHAELLKDSQGRSRGCGLVTFIDAKTAAQAQEHMNNSELKGRVLFVREDRETSTAIPLNRHSLQAGQNVISQLNRQIFVGNLPSEVNWKHLKEHFSSELPVERADIMLHPNGVCKGYGTIRFASSDLAEKAVSLFNGTIFNGHAIEVRPDRKFQ